MSTRQSDVLDAIFRGRWSCRAFLSDPVPENRILRALEIAQRTPSWCNTQPWSVEITSGEVTHHFRKTLERHLDDRGFSSQPDYQMPQQYSGVYQERRRRSGWQLYSAVGIKRGDREASETQTRRNFDFFGAPHVAIVTVASEQETYGVLDSGMYIGSLLLAMQSLGIAAIPQAAIARYAPLVREYFQIPQDRNVLLAISFGFADKSHPVNSYRTDRAEIKDVVRFHRN